MINEKLCMGSRRMPTTTTHGQVTMNIFLPWKSDAGALELPSRQACIDKDPKWISIL